MMTLTEKAAYIKGLIEGMDLDQDKKETKIINALVDIIDDLALSVEDAEDEIAVIQDSFDDVEERLDAVDADLADLEDYVYDDCEGCEGCGDYDFEDDDDDLYEIECPDCGNVFYFDESALDDDEPLTCPECGYVIDEIEIEDDEDEDEDED